MFSVPRRGIWAVLSGLSVPRWCCLAPGGGGGGGGGGRRGGGGGGGGGGEGGGGGDLYGVSCPWRSWVHALCCHMSVLSYYNISIGTVIGKQDSLLTGTGFIVTAITFIAHEYLQHDHKTHKCYAHSISI